MLRVRVKGDRDSEGHISKGEKMKQRTVNRFKGTKKKQKKK